MPHINDVFRKDYKPLTDDHKAVIENIKNKAEELYCAIANTSPALGSDREINEALTSLEESVMWAIKGITK